MSNNFYPLTVIETRQELGGQAKTIMFDVPDKLKATFAWRAGQHLSFRFPLKGGQERRSYSISASPISGEPLQITVKRVNGGVVSNHINDEIKKGDVIDVMPPFGAFHLDAEQSLRRTHYFFGAGSGITPLFAMLHSVMCNEPYSQVHLAYGNKNADSILLQDRLSSLKESYADRLNLQHVLSSPSMWSGFKYWRKGILDQGAIETFLTENPPYAQDAQYYICGPSGMNSAVKSALMGFDVPANRIHMESYGGQVEIDDSVTGIAASAKITLQGKTHTLQIAQGQTLLEAARKAEIKPPFSCQSGVCGACSAQLKKGSVHMRSRVALEDSDIEKGRILTCQSVPTSESLFLTFD